MTDSDSPPPAVALLWPQALWRGRDELPPDVERLRRGYRQMERVGALQWPEVTLAEPDEALAQPDALLAFHEADFVAAVLALGAGHASPRATLPAFATPDDLPSAAQLALAQYAVAATRTAARLVLGGQATRALSLAGGYVHAAPARAQSGHLFNDVALALRDARAAGARVAFVNLDAEHPAAIEQTFAEEADVLTLSLHEGPEFLYPGTGGAREVGRGAGRGASGNVPLPPSAGDREWERAFEAVVAPLLARFQPDITVLVAGASAHAREPLSHLCMTSAGYARLVARIVALSPRLVMVGGAGSDPDVTARWWTLALAALAGREGSPALAALHDAPARKRPAPLDGYVQERTDAAIAQCQQALFPLWSLDPTVARASGSTEPPPDLADGRPAAPLAPATPADESRARRLTADEARAALHSEPMVPVNGVATESRGPRAGSARPAPHARPQPPGRERAAPAPRQEPRAAREEPTPGTQAANNEAPPPPRDGSSRDRRRRRGGGRK